MRQSQKSNRTRSRGRKPSNPLSRSYDSNGPDVKIRGTASHIAEKYQSLARDASASGDIVMAENYYQHAEHYLRIIASATASNRDEGRQANGNGDQSKEERNNRRNNGSNNGANGSNGAVADVNGDEAQPDVAAAENTAIEMEVAVVAEVPGEGEQPDVAAAEENNEEEKAPAPRRRRRTTYRSRKRPAAEDGDGEKAAKPVDPAEAPQPAVAEE